jgi:hypothetical protein
MVDLTGIDLSEDQTAKLSALFDSEIGGLKNKVDELIGEKRNVQQTSQEKDQVIEDARKAAVAAEEQRLVESGKYKEALELREKETAEAIAKANESSLAAKDALTQRDRSDVMNSVMSNIHDDHKWNSEAMLSNMLEIGYNDQNQLTTQFKNNGEVVANNVEEFKSWAGEQDSFKKILKGVDSSGASTTQSRASGSVTNKPFSDMNKAEKLAYMETKANQT